MKTLEQTFEEILEKRTYATLHGEKTTLNELLQAVKERDSYVLKQAGKGHEPIEEIMKQTI